jgi:mannose-6-phosphate isomerase-like protein (cupin superfamily)
MTTRERADVEGDPQQVGRPGVAAPSAPAPSVAAPASSPRPTFDEATPIPYASARLHLWGDEEAGRVPDWIYVSSDKIHHLVFALPPGGRFTHSDRFRTVFAADELLYVLSGTMVIADPEHGEVRRVERGGAVFFRRDTWHHAMSFGTDQLRVLEFFAPPPASGASSSYARTKELLDEVSYRDDRYVGRWPMAADERATVARLHVLGDRDVLERLEGTGVLVRTYVSTEHLAAEQVVLRPGGHTDVRRHGGDAAMHVLAGSVNVLLTEGPNAAGQRWFELHPDDGFYVPEGTSYELRNVTDEPAEAMVAVAPAYDPR